MNLNSKRTPILRIKHEDSSNLSFSNLPNWDNFKCESHPQLQIQALRYNKPSKSFSLVCIKCIIEGDFLKVDGEDESITIKDLMETCARTISQKTTTPYKSKDSLQEKFMGFLIKDYVGTYERHLEAQYQQIDQEIAEVIEKLNQVREKYKKQHNSEMDVVKEQSAEIKSKINQLLESDGSQESLAFSSMSEVYEQLNKLTRHDEILNFFKDLYQKSKEVIGDASFNIDYKKLLANMDAFKEKALGCKNKEIDVSKFTEMKQNLQALLQSDSVTFKKTGLNMTPKDLKTDFDFSSFGHLDTSYNILDSHETDSQIYHSPTLPKKREERTSTISRTRNFERDLESAPTIKKKKRDASTEINSQSLRNLKKELEKNEDEELSKENIITSLHDWINRRITGYLIFQNTMNNDPYVTKERMGLHETGVHLNQAMGKKWKSISTKEQEEYRALAREYRKAFKQEVDSYDNLENVNDLLEELDEKIKKIKRE